MLYHALTNRTTHPAYVASEARPTPPLGACGQGPVTVQCLGVWTYVDLRTRQPVDVRQVCTTCRAQLRGPF